MEPTNWSDAEEVLEYMRNGGRSVYKFGRDLLRNWDFVKVAGEMEPYVFDYIDSDFYDKHEDEIRQILYEKRLAAERAEAELEAQKAQERLERYKKGEFLSTDPKEEIEVFRKEEVRKQLKANRAEYIQTIIMKHTYHGIAFAPTELYELLGADDLQDLSGVEELLSAFPIAVKYIARTDGFEEKYLNNLIVGSIVDCEYGYEYGAFEYYGKDEHNTYIDFVKKLIEVYGKDNIMEKFGATIREKVPEYSIVVDGIDLETPEGIAAGIENGYSVAFLDFKLSQNVLMEALYKKGRLGELYHFYSSIERKDVIEFLTSKGEVPDDVLEQFGKDDFWEDSEIKLLLRLGKELPESAREEFGEEIERLKLEVELEVLKEKDEKLDETIALAKRLDRNVPVRESMNSIIKEENDPRI